MLSVCWHQKGIVCHELRSPGERTAKIKDKTLMIDLHQENVICHRSTIFRNTIQALKWDLLPLPPYSTDLATSNDHLFRSMPHWLAGQHMANIEVVQNLLNLWFRSKGTSFYRGGIRVLTERWQKCVTGADFNLFLMKITRKLSCESLQRYPTRFRF